MDPRPQRTLPLPQASHRPATTALVDPMLLRLPPLLLARPLFVGGRRHLARACFPSQRIPPRWPSLPGVRGCRRLRWSSCTLRADTAGVRPCLSTRDGSAAAGASAAPLRLPLPLLVPQHFVESLWLHRLRLSARGRPPTASVATWLAYAAGRRLCPSAGGGPTDVGVAAALPPLPLPNQVRWHLVGGHYWPSPVTCRRNALLLARARGNNGLQARARPTCWGWHIGFSFVGCGCPCAARHSSFAIRRVGGLLGQWRYFQAATGGASSCHVVCFCEEHCVKEALISVPLTLLSHADHWPTTWTLILFCTSWCAINGVCTGF